MPSVTIGRAAKAAGVNVETIRFYERRGLIEQPPKAGSFRSYSAATVSQIRFIRQAQRIGFSLREVGELLALKADPSADCADIRREAVEKLEEIEAKLAELHRIRSALQTVIGSCPGQGELCGCTILDAIEHSAGADDEHGTANPQTQSSSEKDMQTITITVEGMRCGACAEKVRRLVRAEAGVHEALVSLDQSSARILYDPETITEHRLTDIIERAGYRVAGTQLSAPAQRAKASNDSTEAKDSRSISQ